MHGAYRPGIPALVASFRGPTLASRCKAELELCIAHSIPPQERKNLRIPHLVPRMPTMCSKAPVPNEEVQGQTDHLESNVGYVEEVSPMQTGWVPAHI